VTVWKDPVREMQRTKAHHLLYKNLRKDSSGSHPCQPDYLLLFRKPAQGPGDTPDPVSRRATLNSTQLEAFARNAGGEEGEVRSAYENYQTANGRP
jgi:hypothetical protein